MDESDLRVVYQKELIVKIIKRELIRNIDKRGYDEKTIKGGFNAITIYTLKIHFKGV